MVTNSFADSPMAKDKKYQEIINKRINDLLNGHVTNRSDYISLIDNISRSVGAGTQYSRYQDAFFGLNRLPQMPELPIHKETQGLIFFTKPDLNLTYDNIAGIRQLSHVMGSDAKDAKTTPASAVRYALDPTSQRGKPVFLKSFSPNKGLIRNDLTDAFMPYMTLLSNTCLSMSPPPDIGINLYTSPEGAFREQWIMNDSIAENSGYYDISCTFANIKSNAVLLTFLTWVLYMGYLRTGDGGIKPHPHNRIANRMDYFTRIERFKFDETGRKIEQWFHTGASVPKSISIGAGMGLNKIEPYEFENKEISVQFGSVGAVYQDPIQLWEFNYRMQTWNPTLADITRKKYYYKAPAIDDALTNWMGYPLINLSTLEMDWWIPKDEYKRAIEGIYDIDEYTRKLEELNRTSKDRYRPYKP